MIKTKMRRRKIRIKTCVCVCVYVCIGEEVLQPFIIVEEDGEDEENHKEG